MKRRFCIFGLLLLPSCTPYLGVVPDAAHAQARVARSVTVQILAEPWRGEPYDLTAHFLPVAVEVKNQGAVPIELHLPDFILVDDHGTVTQPCRMDRVLEREPDAVPRPRGPVFATVAPPTSAAIDDEVQLRGETAPRDVSDAVRLALPERPLPPGESMRGYLYFQISDLQRSQALRLRWQAHQAGTSTLLGEAEVRLDLRRISAR